MLTRLRRWLAGPRPVEPTTYRPADVVPPTNPISVDSDDPMERAMAAVVWHTGGFATGNRNKDGSISITVRPPDDE